jgi:predicted nucleotidyltransferase component of viral defense system
MSVEMVQERLNGYRCTSIEEEDRALREITQEIALAALSRIDFFKMAGFHGGTCLRICYGLDRFSEDLDFTLREPDQSFSFNPYFKNLAIEFKAFGYQLEVVDRSKVDVTVKKAFLKDDSLGKVLQLSYIKVNRSMRKIRIKLEIDTNPPLGGRFENKFLSFPFDFSLTVEDLPTLFAGKIQACLGREYLKGRDWFDLLWYLARGTPINLEYVTAGLDQIGPWKGQELTIDQNWCFTELEKKIRSLDWEQARLDTKPFVKPSQWPSLDIWSEEFLLDRLKNYEKRGSD